MGITKHDAIEACYDVVHDQKELGRLLAFVDGLPDETLAILRGGSSNEAIVEFLRAKAAAAAEAAAAAAATRGGGAASLAGVVGQGPSSQAAAEAAEAAAATRGGGAGSLADDFMELMQPPTEVLCMKLHIHATPRHCRSAISSLMVQHRVKGIVRRISPTTVFVTAVVRIADKPALLNFTKDVVNMAPLPVEGADSGGPYTVFSGTPQHSSDADHLKLLRTDVKVHKVPNVVLCAYKDMSLASADGDDAQLDGIEMVSTHSS